MKVEHVEYFRVRTTSENPELALKLAREYRANAEPGSALLPSGAQAQDVVIEETGVRRYTYMFKAVLHTEERPDPPPPTKEVEPRFKCRNCDLDVALYDTMLARFRICDYCLERVILWAFNAVKKRM